MDRFKTEVIDLNDPAISIAEIFASHAQSGNISLPLEKTIHHLVALSAKTALIQFEVSDPDFEAEYDLYYVRWTYKVERRCVRIHFFSDEVKEDKPLKVIDELYELSRQSNNYLGFVTLRPIQRSEQGATILRPHLHPEGSSFVVSKDRFEVNIAGRKFVVTGTPFLQQDNAVGACAQASIWMALRTLRRKIGQNAYSPAAITEAATRFGTSGRTLPNRSGLSISQIIEAVRQSGYSPHSFALKSHPHDRPNAAELAIMRLKIYPYIESGIPVLLGLSPKNQEGHAVLVIGHDWDKNVDQYMHIDTRGPKGPPNWVSSAGLGELDLVDASSWINHIYIHNDNTGPYQPLFNSSTGGYSLSDALVAIPFLHKDILMDAEEAQLACYTILLSCLSKDHKEQLPRLVFRVYLQTRSEFRESVIESKLHDQAKEYYRLKWLPKRVWVAEINEFKDYENAPDGKAVKLGEILLDPSSDPADGHFLAVRLSKELLNLGGEEARYDVGVMIDRDPFDGTITGKRILSGTCDPIARGTS
ncbi:MAG: hypothetical protein ABJQ78_09060 [Alloalcanivorax sp.]